MGPATTLFPTLSYIFVGNTSSDLTIPPLNLIASPVRLSSIQLSTATHQFFYLT